MCSFHPASTDSPTTTANTAEAAAKLRHLWTRRGLARSFMRWNSPLLAIGTQSSFPIRPDKKGDYVGLGGGLPALTDYSPSILRLIPRGPSAYQLSASDRPSSCR